MPLLYGAARDAYFAIGSRDDADTQPDWYLNLRANPAVEVQVARDHFPARARDASDQERKQLWEQILQLYPPYRDYQQKTNHEIPIVVLEKQFSLP